MLITQNPKPIVDPPPPPPVQDRSRPEDVLEPETPLSAAFLFVEPTWRNYIMYVDAEARTGNLNAARYLTCYNGIDKEDRQVWWPEQLCAMAQVPHEDLLCWVVRQAWISRSARTNLVMHFMRDQVLEKNAQFAMAAPENYKHTELFFKASGLIPIGGSARSAAGPAVTIFNSPSSSSVALSGSKSESSPVTVSGLRDMDADIVELSRIMQTGSVAARAESEPDDSDDDEDDKEDDE